MAADRVLLARSDVNSADRETLLVRANSFAEYAPELKPDTKKKDVVWFALNDDRPLFAFAASG